MRYNHFDMLPINAFRKIGGRITLEGGGGGGGDGGAGQREAERQARVAAATDQINRIFNGEVLKTGTRYRKSVPQVFRFGASRSSSPSSYISEDEYQSLVTQKNAQQPQVRNGPFGMVFSEGFSDPTAGLVREDYTYWAKDPEAQRQKLYDEQKAAVYELNTKEVDRQATEAERANRFGLARTGLLGGSADIDSNAELNRRTNEGLLRAGGIADQSAADLQAQDERTRANLISMAQSGIDTGTAASMALSGLSANANQAASARSGATVGGLFDDLSQAYLTNQIITGRNAAMTGYGQNNVTATAGPQATYGGNVNK